MPDTTGSDENPSHETDSAPTEDFATLFAASEAQTRQTRVSVGDLVSGRVIAIGQNAAFIAIGGKGEATIDLGEFRDSATGEVKLALDDKVEATVIDDGSRSGTVTLKRVLGRGGHVSAELEQALASRVPVEGIVTREVKGGFEVQIGSSRAFCPGSQIDRRRGPERVPGSEYIGQRFLFRVVKVENNGRNIVVSRREILDEEAAIEAAQTWARIQVGAVLQGRVTSVRDFGAFVDLGGVEGLIHISEIGYGRVRHPSDVLAPNQPVEVQVLRVDEPGEKGRRQIALSLKALAMDPWVSAAETFAPGTMVAGTVRRLEAFGAFVEIAPGIEGLVHISKITLDRRLAHARQALSVGQPVEVMVLTIDPQQRRLSLSMVEQARQAQEQEIATERREHEALIARTNQQKSFGSLSELLQRPRRS